MNKIEKYQKTMREKNGSIKKVEQEITQYSNDLVKELNTNPEYSLDIDPLNQYNFNDIEKRFIHYYTKYKNIPLAANLSGIDNNIATDIFSTYAVEKEIRRINRALYLRQFNHKILTIEQLGGWLSSLITDENIPDADRLKTTDKLKVAQMLIDLNDYRRDAFNNPETIMSIPIEEQLKDLSVETIKQLIYSTKKVDDKEKRELLDRFKNQKSLSVEEIAYLNSLSSTELLNMLNQSIANKLKEDKDE